MDYRKFTQRFAEERSNALLESAKVLEESSDLVQMCPDCGFTKAGAVESDNDTCPKCGNAIIVVHSKDKKEVKEDSLEEEVELVDIDEEEGTYTYEDEETGKTYTLPFEVAAYIDPATGELAIIPGYVELIHHAAPAIKDEVVAVEENFELSRKQKLQVINEAAELGRVIKVRKDGSLVVPEGYGLVDDSKLEESISRPRRRRGKVDPK